MVEDFIALRTKILRRAQGLVIEATLPGSRPIDKYCLLYQAALKGGSALLPQIPSLSGAKARKPISVWKELSRHKICVEWIDYFLEHSAVVSNVECGIPHVINDTMLNEFYVSIQHFLAEIETVLHPEGPLKLAS